MNNLRSIVLQRPQLTRGFSIRGRPAGFGMTKRIIMRRADIPDDQLEAAVKPCLDSEGRYAHGMLPEMFPDYKTHHDADWSEGGPHVLSWPISHVLLGWALFFGSIFLFREYMKTRFEPEYLGDRVFHNVEEELGGAGNYPTGPNRQTNPKN